MKLDIENLTHTEFKNNTITKRILTGSLNLNFSNDNSLLNNLRVYKR